MSASMTLLAQVLRIQPKSFQIPMTDPWDDSGIFADPCILLIFMVNVGR